MNHESRITNPDFLQSEGWLRFQEEAGHEIVRVTSAGFPVGGIVHSLPIVGRYLYTPRYPSLGISNFKFQISKVIEEARSRGCGWVRVEPGTEAIRDEILRLAQNDKLKTVKASHDMQPRETFVIDISKDEDMLLAEMKSKTRYNIRLAEKKGVRVFLSNNERFRKAFVDLVTGTADRKGIVPHPRKYYEKMLETLLGDTATLFVAEHESDILGVNLMVFHDGTATYLHGGSADVKREYMAPFLLQWEAIREAKRRGCTRYDFGGVKTGYKMQDAGCRMRESEGTERKGDGKNHTSLIMHHVSGDWAGITRFKTGFSPATEPTVFPGCYDIVLSPARYFLYRFFSIFRAHVTRIRKSAGV